MQQTHHLRRCLWLLLCLAPAAASAHVGSRDIYLQGNAGPYPVYISIQPPVVIPGLATVSVFVSASNDVALQEIDVQPNVLSSDPNQRMPEAQKLEHNPVTHVYQGSVWLMTNGSWQLRFQAHGALGDGVLAVPVPATSTRLKRMDKTLGTILVIACILLILGFIGMTSAVAREAFLDPGVTPNAEHKKRGKIGILAGIFFCFGVLLLGNHWWRVEIARYSGTIYKPLKLNPQLSADDSTLHLSLTDPGWILQRHLDDLVPDHNHLMHLYLIRQPAMDVVMHLHPKQLAPGEFDLNLPAMPAGYYSLYADIVHADGFPETAVATLDLPAKTTPAISPDADDSTGTVPPLGAADTSTYTLPDGYQIKFAMSSPGQEMHTPTIIAPTQPIILQFTLLDAHGQPPPNMQNYMGMLGHAAILKTDGTVFAHIHPEGSIAMAAYMMVNHAPDAMAGMDMSGMPMPAEKLPNVVAFPYGFPSAGKYRIVIQMKHDGTIETGAFDLTVQ